MCTQLGILHVNLNLKLYVTKKTFFKQAYVCALVLKAIKPKVSGLRENLQVLLVYFY
jgi:hypothetical protein